jgi:bacterioferritin (cytochrome b1)
MLPFAGIENPDRPGLFVPENSMLLRRYAWIEQHLLRLLAGRVPGTAEMDGKHALARHSWEDAQHARALRERIPTMRTSEKLLDDSPDPALDRVLLELGHAADLAELLAGTHLVVKAALIDTYRWHLETTNHIADFPTVRELRIVLREEEDQVAWARDAVADLSKEAGVAERVRRWQEHLRTLLAAAGGVTGREPRPEGLPEPLRSEEPFRISRHPRRDPSYPVNFQFNEPGDPRAETVPEKLIFMMRGRLNEMAATENPAATIYELDGQPFEFYAELSRHMFDEARHSMLGRAVIEHLGEDPRTWPLRIGPGYSYLSIGPLERFAHLGINVEQAMMKYPPGKRQEYEWCRDVAQDALAAMYQDYDWSDEVYHTQIARRWVGRAFDNNREQMVAFAKEAGQRMAANTRAIAEAWHAKRAAGATLAEGDPLPSGGDTGEPMVSEYAQDQEITLTREQVERDLQHVE